MQRHGGRLKAVLNGKGLSPDQQKCMYVLTVRPADPVAWRAMNLATITLTPSKAP